MQISNSLLLSRFFSAESNYYVSNYIHFPEAALLLLFTFLTILDPLDESPICVSETKETNKNMNCSIIKNYGFKSAKLPKTSNDTIVRNVQV